MKVPRIKFSKSLFEVDLGQFKLNAIKPQQAIFVQMATYITKYLDLDVDYFMKIIQFAASKWQNEGDTLFQYFERASPQERLHVAVKFSDDFRGFLEPFLENPHDKGSLSKIIEKSLEYY